MVERRIDGLGEFGLACAVMDKRQQAHDGA
jgi:hypothetical protein